jgi:hypothetical protein
VTPPRPSIEIVYLLAGGAKRRAELLPRTRAALEHADYAWLARELANRRLLPLIGSRTVEAAPDLVPASFRDAVSAARAAARAHGMGLEVATARLVTALERTGIRVLALKGPHLANDAHGDLGLRETSDVDLLVDAGRIEDAVEVLNAHGYSPPTDVRRPNGLPDLHFELHHESQPSVDLHWRVYWYERAFSERLIARAERGRDGLLRAQPDDLVASLLLFYARDGFHGIRMAADIAGWWDRHGAALAPGFLAAHATSFPQLAPALSAAATAVEQVTGTPASHWLGDSLRRPPRVAAAARLADWCQSGDRDQMSANISLVGELLRPPGSWREFARRELLLPGKGCVASSVHAAKVVARGAYGRWRVRGGRRWTESA